MKYFKWVFVGLMSLFIAVALCFFAANLQDEALNPEVDAIVKAPLPATEQGTKAFYYFIGIRAGDARAAEATGQRVWEEALAKAGSNDQTGFFDMRLRADLWPSLPFPERSGVLSEQWKTRSEVREALNMGLVRTTIEQYKKLLGYGELSPLNCRDFATSAAFSPTMVLNGHKWLRFHMGELVAAGKWKDAERLVQQEAHFARSLLSNNTLLTTMIAAVVIRNDAEFLADEIKANPKLKLRADTVRELRISPVEEIAESVLKTELRFFALLMPMVLHSPNSAQLLGDNRFVVSEGLERHFLLPNEAANKFYRFTQEVRTRRCPPLDLCYESVRWSRPEWPWQYLRNPTGKMMFRIFATSLSGRFAKLEISKTQVDALAASLAAHVAP